MEQTLGFEASVSILSSRGLGGDTNQCHHEGPPNKLKSVHAFLTTPLTPHPSAKRGCRASCEGDSQCECELCELALKVAASSICNCIPTKTSQGQRLQISVCRSFVVLHFSFLVRRAPSLRSYARADFGSTCYFRCYAFLPSCPEEQLQPSQQSKQMVR